MDKKGVRKGKKFRERDIKENLQYYAMMIIPMTAIIIFSYLPMFGIVISFQNYVAGRPFFGEGVQWVGLKWFKQFVSSYYFPRILKNTFKFPLKEKKNLLKVNIKFYS